MHTNWTSCCLVASLCLILCAPGATQEQGDANEPTGSACDPELARHAEESETGYGPSVPDDGHGDPCCEGTFSLEVSTPQLTLTPIGCTVLALPKDDKERIAALAWEPADASVHVRATPRQSRAQYRMDAVRKPRQAKEGENRPFELFHWNTSRLELAGLKLQSMGVMAWIEANDGGSDRRVLLPLVLNGPAESSEPAEKRAARAAKARVKLTLWSSAPLFDQELKGSWIHRDETGDIVEEVEAEFRLHMGTQRVDVSFERPADGKVWILLFEASANSRTWAQEPVHVRVPTTPFQEWAFGAKKR